MQSAPLAPPLVVGLVQVNQPHIGRMFLPYSVALLEAYTRQYAPDPTRYLFLLPLFQRCTVKQALQSMQWVHIAGFSIYTWNAHFSLAVAQALKTSKPETLIVFGGPHVPDRAEDFLRQHSFIDICVHGEGEAVFLAILEQYPRNQWQTIAGISYLDTTGAFIHHPKAPRLTDLNVIPSPYLENTFAPLIQAHPDQSWIALWETNRGCPFSCTFCDWGSAVQSKIYPFAIERLRAEIEWFSRHRIWMVFSCDANFGILKRDIEIAEYLAHIKANHGYPQSFVLQNTKNMTERAYQLQQILGSAQLNPAVTLSMQSLNPLALANIKRQNISLETYRELQRRFRHDGILTYTDILIGLPGETYDSFANGIAQVIEEGQHHRIQYFNVYVLPNAEMAHPAYRQQHGIETVNVPYVFAMEEADKAGDGIYESQEMVVATHSMTRQEWGRMRTFAWYSELLHLNRKLLQIPFIVMHEHIGLSYRHLIEVYMDLQAPQYPLLMDIHRFFDKTIQDILQGAPVFCATTFPPYDAKVWLEAYDYVLMGLLKTDALAVFYEENQRLLDDFLHRAGKGLPPGLLDEALQLNQVLVLDQAHSQPFEISASYNLWEYYQAHLHGKDTPLNTQAAVYYKDWQGQPYFQVKTRLLGRL